MGATVVHWAYTGIMAKNMKAPKVEQFYLPPPRRLSKYTYHSSKPYNDVSCPQFSAHLLSRPDPSSSSPAGHPAVFSCSGG